MPVMTRFSVSAALLLVAITMSAQSPTPSDGREAKFEDALLDKLVGNWHVVRKFGDGRTAVVELQQKLDASRETRLADKQPPVSLRRAAQHVDPIDAVERRQRPDLAQPYSEIRTPTPQLNEDPNAILLPLVGSGVLAHTNAAGDLDPSPPTRATDDWIKYRSSRRYSRK